MHRSVILIPDQYMPIMSAKVDKTLDEMTFGDALAIVLGQARESDFHDEVVEQACQMTEYSS